MYLIIFLLWGDNILELFDFIIFTIIYFFIWNDNCLFF